MGTGQGGLRTGLLAAFGTEGYEGEPPLLEELGVNFGHIRMKVCSELVEGGICCEDVDVLIERCVTDSDGAESYGADRQPYHGRLGLSGTVSVLRVVWNVPTSREFESQSWNDTQYH